jgi:uncharacterized protein YecE (DUF72 family)
MTGASRPIFVGIAGWSLRSEYAAAFPSEGTHLERYARRFPAVEINSSFYRPHKPETYARWAASTPEGFRFAVKVPKELTHTRRLKDPEPLGRFLEEVGALGEKLGPLLVQLPPSLAFNPETAGAFFAALRALHSGPAVCEPRHRSWFTPQAGALLEEHRVGRVAADPALNEQAAEPSGWPELAYYRLHGSPRMYYSAYSAGFLEQLAHKLAAAARTGRSVWCIFDNTAEGEAIGNALELVEELESR